ncbi:MAG: HAD-IIIA family hydrolase [Candidatus Limnocylindrales bacterium]
MTSSFRGHPPKQAVILAGGLGLRMRPLTDAIPKPMIEFHGRPFLAYLVDQLRDAGIERIVMLLGYLPDVITDHFGDGRDWGVSITYSVTAPELQTGTRVRTALDAIDPVFLLLYCDNYWPMRLDRMWERYSSAGAPAMTTIYRNRDRFSRDNVRVEHGWIRSYDPTRTADGLSGVEIGYAILARSVVEDLLPATDVSLESAIYPTLAARGQLLAYPTDHRYYGIGSMERLPTTSDFLARRPTILLDRDGVLNRKPARAEYVRRPDEFEWLAGALDGVRLLTERGYRLLVISNQAGVARGAMTDGDLMDVDSRMMADAAAAGGHIERAYYCRHDWDADCDCRKPKAGMLHQAQRDFHLDLSRTPYIGDDDRDGEAAELAGSPFIQVTEERSLLTIARSLTTEAS